MFEVEHMKCMENLSRTRLPNDVIMDYIKVYKSIGINQHNHEVLESDYDVIVRQTVRNDTYYFAKMFQIKVTDARFKSLIFKDVKPKNKDEKLIINLRNAFTKIHDESSTFELLVTEILDLIKFLYGDVLAQSKLSWRRLNQNERSSSLLTSKNASTRESVDQLVQLFNKELRKGEYELSYIILNFYIDFVNIKPFHEKNEEIGIILLFTLLVGNGFEVFEYISFFERLYKRRKEFEQAVVEANFNWELGYSQILPLHKLILDIAMRSYQQLSYLVRDYQFDQHLNKSDNVENTINKLGDVFSKDDIRNVHPYISDSTINRTLKRLRDDKQIRPMGKGRSAKWIKLVKTKNKKIHFEQLDLDI